MPKRKWTEDKLAEMAEWRRDNDKTIREAAAHFKVSMGAYSGAMTKWGGRKLSTIAHKKVPAIAGTRKYNKRPKTIEFESSPPPKQKPIAMILMDQDQFRSVMEAMWL